LQHINDARFKDLDYNRFENSDRIISDTILSPSLLRYLPLTIKLPSKSLYHSSYYRVSLQNDVANIFTVHDFTHKRGLATKFPRKLIHITFTWFALYKADGIICISENTKNDLLFFYPRFKNKNIKVIHHGVSEQFYKIQNFDNLNLLDSLYKPLSYVIFIGKREGYKKFDIVVEALKQLENLNLLIIGGGELTEQEIKLIESCIPNRFKKIDNLDTSNLNILYNAAFALIYPSIYEGFGFPVVEAMRSGCPVITNSLSSLPEVAGDAALYMKDISAESIVENINLLYNVETRFSAIQKGFEHSKKFTWEKCYKNTLDFYNTTWALKFEK
jgi:mannosyltransferase